jgi:hypothetical protein
MSCGGDECDADSLSLLIHICIHRHTNGCLFVCFSSLSIADSWLANSDSLSLRIQSCIPARILVCVSHDVYICLFFIFVLLSIPYSWLPNSLFLLDTGRLIWAATSCRPCHRTFLPGFHRLGECACFSWLSTEILCLSESFSESVDFLSLRDS